MPRLQTRGAVLMASHGSSFATAIPSQTQAVLTGGRGYGARESALWFPVNISAAAPGPNLTTTGVVRSEWTWFPEFNDGAGNTTPHIWNRLSEFLQYLHDLEQEDADGDGAPMHCSVIWTELYGGRLPFGADTGASWVPYDATGVTNAANTYLTSHATAPVHYRHWIDADGATSSVFPTRAPNSYDPNLLTLLKIASQSRQRLFEKVCPITTAKGNALHPHLIGDHIGGILANATGSLANFELTGGVGSTTSLTSGNGGRIQFPAGIAGTGTGSVSVTLPTSGRDSHIQCAVDNAGLYVGLLRDTTDRDKHELVCFTQITDSGGGSGSINLAKRGWGGTTAQTWSSATAELRLFKFDTATWGTWDGSDWSETTYKNWLGRPGPTAAVTGFVSSVTPASSDASNSRFAGSAFKCWDWAAPGTGVTMPTDGYAIPRSFSNYFGQLRCLPPNGTSGPGTGANATKWPVVSLDADNRPYLEWLDKASLPWVGASIAVQDQYLRRLFAAFAILNAITVMDAHASMPWITYNVKIADWLGGTAYGAAAVECTGTTTTVSGSTFNVSLTSTKPLSGTTQVAPDDPTACASTGTLIALYFAVGEGRAYRDRFLTGYTSCRLEVTPAYDNTEGNPRGVVGNGIGVGKMWMLRNAKELGLGVGLQITGKSANDANEDNKAAARITQWVIDTVAPATWEAANSSRGNGASNGETDDPDSSDFAGLTAAVHTLEVWTGFQRFATYSDSPVASAQAAALASNFKRQMSAATYRRRAAPGRRAE